MATFDVRKVNLIESQKGNLPHMELEKALKRYAPSFNQKLSPLAGFSWSKVTTLLKNVDAA